MYFGPEFELDVINEKASRDPAGFLRECDRMYQDKIDAAAKAIAANRENSPIVLLSGPSGSGKTTTARKIRDALQKMGISTHSVEMDNYFRDRTAANYPRTPDGQPDLESPYCLDLALLNEHFSMLSRGERIRVPRFDFSRQMRSMSSSMILHLKKDEMVIFEGIHALNSEITGVHPEAFRLYVSARSGVTVGDQEIFKGTLMRLMRRTVRDSLFRGSDAAYTMSLWANVRRGEKAFISPFKDTAHIQLDTSFPCEVNVLHDNAARLFAQVPEGIERYEELREILPTLERFVDIPDVMLAPDSMLREFIGGGIYDL